MSLLHPFRKSQQASHELNQDNKRRNEQRYETRPGDQRETRRPDIDLLGFDFAGKHQTILKNPFSRRK